MNVFCAPLREATFNQMNVQAGAFTNQNQCCIFNPENDN
jgi:hypothetical protein